MMSWGCGAHCGDALFALSYLRRCEGDHTLHVLPEFVEALRPLAHDRRVHIADTTNLPPNAEDTWMANGRHESKGLFFRNQEDIMGFIFGYFNAFSPAWKSREDMLFDWPWLRPLRWRDSILILNTQPMSGQCPGYSQSELNKLAVDLTLDGHRVVMVNDKDTEAHQYSLLQIACLSASAKLIIGGASGPFFVTMNTAAKECHRIVLLDPMHIDYGPGVGPINTVKNVTEARSVLKGMNYLKYL
jgi:hypothetical protein